METKFVTPVHVEQVTLNTLSRLKGMETDIHISFVWAEPL